MFLYISTVFIAELIIVTSLIMYLIKINKQVVKINESIIALKPEIAKGLNGFALTVKKFQNAILATTCAVKYKKNEYTWKIFKSIIIHIIPLIAKGKYKKLALLFELIGAIQSYTSDSRV